MNCTMTVLLCSTDNNKNLFCASIHVNVEQTLCRYIFVKMKIRKATEDDAMSFMTVTNLAYIVEKGDSGAGFTKEGTRYDTIDNVKDVLEYMSVAELPGKMVGVIGPKEMEIALSLDHLRFIHRTKAEVFPRGCWTLLRINLALQ